MKVLSDFRYEISVVGVGLIVGFVMVAVLISILRVGAPLVERRFRGHDYVVTREGGITHSASFSVSVNSDRSSRGPAWWSACSCM